MIELSYYQLILFFLLFVFSYFSYRQIKHILFFLKIKKAHKKTLKNYEDKVTKMKDEGRMHKWVTLPIRIPGEGIKETQVCEETGYCPGLNGFVDAFEIKQMLGQRKTEEEFKVFKEARISELAEEYSMTEEAFSNIVEEIYSMKKNFHVKKMEESIKELKEQFGDNVTFVSDISELDKILKEKKDEPIQ